MNDVEDKTRKELRKAVEIIESQSYNLEEYVYSINSIYDYNIAMLPGAASTIVTYGGDFLKKQETVLDLTLEGRYGEAMVILRSMLEQAFGIIYLADNSSEYREFLSHHKIEEKRATGEIEENNLDSKFNYNIRGNDGLLEKVGEEEYGSLYSAISETEVHLNLRPLRDNVGAYGSGYSLRRRNTFKKRDAVAIFYLLYYLVDKVYQKGLKQSIHLKTADCSAIGEYQSRRDDDNHYLNSLYSELDLGRKVE